MWKREKHLFRPGHQTALRHASTPTIKITDIVAFSTHGLPIMHIIIYMKFSANLVYILFYSTVNFFPDMSFTYA